MMTELPRAATDRVIRKGGAQRISESAAEELAEILEENGIEIASEVAELAEFAGRKPLGIQMSAWRSGDEIKRSKGDPAASICRRKSWRFAEEEASKKKLIKSWFRIFGVAGVGVGCSEAGSGMSSARSSPQPSSGHFAVIY